MNKKGRSTQYAPKHFYSETEMPIANAIYNREDSKLKELLKNNKSIDISKPGKMGTTYLQYAMSFQNTKLGGSFSDHALDGALVLEMPIYNLA